MALPMVRLLLSEKLDELLQVLKAEHCLMSSNNQKGIRWSETGPCQGKGAVFVTLGVGEEDTHFSPGRALRQPWKRLARGRMKGMGHGEAMLPIGGIRKS